MATQIRIMTTSASGTIDTTGDIAHDLGLSEVSPAEVLYGLQDIEPDHGWHLADGYDGWGIVLRAADGRTLSITEGD